MTNEDLALLIQKTGDYNYICQLWERVYKLIKRTAFQYKNRNMLPTVVDVEDFTQCGYFAMIKAVQAFNAANGWKFNTYLGYYLKHVRRSLSGPVTNITEISLNTPIADGGAELADIIPDETVQLDNSLEREEIAGIMFDELNKLSSDEAYAIIEHWYHNASYNEIAAELGVTYADVRRVINRGLRKLRKSRPLYGIFLTYYAGADYLNEYRPHIADKLSVAKGGNDTICVSDSDTMQPPKSAKWVDDMDTISSNEVNNDNYDYPGRTKLEAAEKYLSDPENMRKFKEWHLRKFGYIPGEENDTKI